MRAVTLAFAVAAVTAMLAAAAALMPRPSSGAYAAAKAIAQLARKPGVHFVYVPGTAEFAGGRVVVEVGGERASVSVSGVGLVESRAGPGLIAVYSDGSRAWLARP